MATLPPELLRLIASQVTFDLVYHPEHRVYRYDRETLRSLRLVSQAFSVIASEPLFAEAVLFFTESSHAKMTAIAQHPIYSKYVRSLSISPKAIFGPLLDRSKFEEWLRGERSLVGSDGWFLRDVQPAERPHISATVADYHYAQYVSLHIEQQQLFANAGSLLLTAVSRFSRIEKVKAGPSAGTTPYSIPFDWDVRIRDGWQDGMRLYQIDLEHSIMVLTALYRAQTMAGSPPDISGMFHLVNAMIMDLPKSENSLQIEKLITDVKALPIWINTFETHGFLDLLEKGRCARFLGLMKNLESLSISISHVTMTPFICLEVPQIFSDTTWPHLRRLELGGFYATTTELSDLFRRHKSTLDILVLTDVSIDSESWYQVFADLRGGFRGDISVYHLGCGHYDPDFFEDATDPTFNPMPETHPLLTFLFKGGPWVEGMDELLECGEDSSSDEGDSTDIEDSDGAEGSDGE